MLEFLCTTGLDKEIYSLVFLDYETHLITIGRIENTMVL